MSFWLSISQKQAELRARQDELTQLPINSERKLSQLRVTIGDIELRLRQTDGDRAYLIRRPRPAASRPCRLGPGNQSIPTSPLMSIVPEGDTLDAELFLPTHAIGFVSRADRAHQLHQLSIPAIRFCQRDCRNRVPNTSQTRTVCGTHHDRYPSLFGPCRSQKPDHPGLW